MVKFWNGTLRKCILLLTGSAFAGTLLLAAVYLLPVEPMRARVTESIDIFYTEGVYPQIVQKYKGSQLDNETDAIMLLNAIDNETGESVLKRAMAVPRIYMEGEDSGCRTLVSWVWENREESGRTDYGRYWHGYLIWLKPLLLVFSYADIRYLNMFLQFFLLMWTIVQMTEKGMKRYLAPFGIAVLVANPVAVAMSLQFSSIYYLILVSFIFILSKSEWLRENNRYQILFFALGIGTAYFDFLTYPTAALVMPLVLVLLIEKPQWKHGWKQTVLLAAFWGAGYLGMWGLKWVLCLCVLHNNILEEVMQRIACHTGEVEIMGEKINAFGVLGKNIKVFGQMPYLVLALAAVIGIMAKHGKMKVSGNVRGIIPLLAVSVIPVLWILGTKSHAGWCYWYTSRGLMGTAFALFSALAYLYDKRQAGSEIEGKGAET